ncbi:MAG: protein kinase [Gemmataceae bacterium]|nr:protein kinase [Gemmataceae bacterium]
MDLRVCPSRDQLAAYLLGRVPSEQLDVVSAHLEGCSSCQAGADSLDHLADDLVALLRLPSGGPGTAPAGDTQLRQLVGRIEALGFPPAVVPSPSPPAPPRQLGGCELLEPLGEGGMGVVYKAWHLTLKRVVAVKVIHPRKLDDPGAVAVVRVRFQREAEAGGRLAHHEHIVQVLHADRAGADTPFLVMEYIDGTSLQQLCRQRRGLPLAEGCEAVRQAAVGLHYAHEHGLVHRDIKPANLMLTREGQVKVNDWGLARLGPGAEEAAVGVTEERTALGTAPYAAPEQWRDARTVDRRADIYSLGCTLFELLVGRAPPAPGTEKEQPPGRRPLVVPSETAGVPAEVRNIVARMTAANPQDRYATADEVARELRPFAQGARLDLLHQPPPAEPVPLPPTVDFLPPDRPAGPEGFRRRRRARIGLGLTAGALAVGALILLDWGPGTTTPEGQGGPAEERQAKGAPGRPAPVLGDQPPGPVVSLTGRAPFPTACLLFTPDGRQAVCVDRGICFWDLDKRKPLRSWEWVGANSRSMYAGALSPDGKVLAVAASFYGPQSTIHFYDAQTYKAAREAIGDRGSELLCLAYCPRGQRVVAGGNGGVIRLWDARTGKKTGEFRHGDSVTAVAFSPDGGQLVTAGGEKTLRLWDLKEDRQEKVFEGHTGLVDRVAFVAGRRVLSASSVDRTIRAWSLATGKEVGPPLPTARDDGALLCTAFSADGRRALTGHQNGAVVLWDLDTRQAVGRYRQHKGPVSAVAISPDGQHALSTGNDSRDRQLVWLYRLPPGD